MSGETMTSLAHERHVATGTRSLYCTWCGTWPPEDRDSLDAAWAAAEAALPEGWRLDVGPGYVELGSGGRYMAGARATGAQGGIGRSGPSPAAALRALAAALAVAR